MSTITTLEAPHGQMYIASQLLNDVIALRKSDPGLILRFFNHDEGFIRRTEQSVGSTPDKPENHATCTAFTLYYLCHSNLVQGSEQCDGTPLLAVEQVQKAIDSLGEALSKGHPGSRDGSDEARPYRETDTAVLPNEYNSPIQMAGYLRAVRHTGNGVPSETRAACDRIATYLVGLIESNGGFVQRIGSPRRTGSAYLTYWAVAALREWDLLSSRTENNPAIALGIAAVCNWGEKELSSAIAHHYGGVASRFDPIQLAYSALICTEYLREPEALQLAAHGMKLLFANYFQEGCFSPSAPVLADRHNFSLLVPTVEVLSLILVSGRKHWLDHWQHLAETFSWLSRHKGNSRGWAPETDGYSATPTAFMTVGSIVFLSGLANVLDEVLSEAAAKALGVSPYIHDLFLQKYQYPSSLGSVIVNNVVIPQRQPELRPLASYSMILYGPPGTSKSTIASKLAQDLEWPLLVINQSAFLTRGVDLIDSEAERIFMLASWLKKVVILFDEVEELVTNRAGPDPDKLSRFLTTAMLPRIHHLRDRKRVVFIFATNRVESIDSAVTRLGRFDIIKVVLPPTEQERRDLLEAILTNLAVGPDIRAALEQADVVGRTDCFGFQDLLALIKRLLVASRIEGTSIDKASILDIISHSRPTVEETAVQAFRNSGKENDRPWGKQNEHIF